MSSHNHPFEAYGAPVEKADPGDAGTINIDRSPMVVNLVSTAAQTRTLARPTQQGAEVRLFFKTDGGDITVTVTGGYNETGDTTIVFANAGEFATFVSFFDGSNYLWRLTSHHGIGNVSITNANALASNRVVAITGSTTITPEAHANKTVLINANDDMTITLAALSGTGNKYRIALGVSLSSKTATIVAPGKHLFGGVAMGSDDTVGTTLTFNTLIPTNAGGATNIILNGSTTGGRKGDWVEIEDAASSVGLVNGMLNCSGTEATPFS